MQEQTVTVTIPAQWANILNRLMKVPPDTTTLISLSRFGSFVAISELGQGKLEVSKGNQPTQQSR